MSKDESSRRRIVVEEVGTEPVSTETVTEIKEKVEELQDLTETISESVEKSADVQEEIAKAVEEVAPAVEAPPQPMPQIKSSSGPNPLMIIVPGIFLLGALLGGIYFYQKGISLTSSSSPSPLPDYNNTVTAPPVVATPIVKVDLSKYPVNVMNGSGISGQAGVVKDLLTTAGFTVSAAGNASSYDFTKTVIKAKADVPASVVTQLSTALSKSYVLDTNVTLATSSPDTIQVIVGSTKAQ